MRPGGRVAGGLIAFAASIVFAASAGAYVVRLGPESVPSTPPTGKFECRGGCVGSVTAAQVSSVEAYAAPAAGVITSWRVDGAPPVALRVVQPVPGGWIGAGTSEPATNFAGGPNPADLEIGAGEAIGVDAGEGGEVGFEREGLPAGDVSRTWYPALGEGGAAREGELNPFANPGSRLMLSAEVELTPIVTSVSPASGSTAGGTSVAIAGKYLDSAVNVVFGSHPAATFSVDVSGERITATTPPSAAGTVDVHVSNHHSTSETVAADRYTFVAPAPTGPPGGAGSGPGAAPTVTGFKESATRWRRGSALPHIAATPVGTTFAFSLNEPASIALSFARLTGGRRVGHKCVAPNHGNRGKARCKRTVSAGALGLTAHAGPNTIGFEGRLSRAVRLAPGSYTVSITSHGSGGSKTLTRPLSFTVLP